MALNTESGKAVDTLEKSAHFGRVASLPEIESEMRIQHHAFFYPLTYCYENEELLQRKHLYFYCYYHMPSVSKYIFHYMLYIGVLRCAFLKTVMCLEST